MKQQKQNSTFALLCSKWAILVLLAGFAFPSMAYGQGGSLVNGIIVLGSTGRPVAGATVTICAASGAGVPCTPLANVFSDPGLTIPLPNPTTTDGNGNIFAYAAPGVYKYTVTGNGVSATGQPFTATVANTGIPATGTGALQAAIQSCIGQTSCSIDASNPAIGTQAFTSNPFSGVNIPVTLVTGPYTVQWDHAAVFVDLPAHSHWTLRGTTLLNSSSSTGASISPLTPSIVDYGCFLCTKMYQTTGSITTATNSLTVASASNLQVGAMAAVVGANGSLAAQATTTNGATGTGASFNVAATTGWDITGSGKVNYLKIENELLSCTGGTGSSFTGCTRGIFGTTSVSHANGLAVQAVNALVSEIAGISGNTVTLADNASLTVTGATVYSGVTDVTIDGSGTLNGNQTVGSPTTRLIGIMGAYSTGLTVAGGIKIKNFDHGGTLLTASRYNLIAPEGYEGNGKPAIGAGVDAWLFEQASNNTIRTGSHLNGSYASLADDRSGNFTINSGNSNNNLITLGPIEGPYNTCINVEGGSSQNTIYMGRCKASVNGVQITASNQWTVAPTPSNNTIFFGSIDGGAGNSFNNSLYTGGNNYMTGGNVIGGTVAIAQGDTLLTGNFAGVRVTHLAQNAASGDLAGTTTLSGGTKVLTFLQPYNSNPICIAQDVTTIANTVQCVATTTQATFTGTGTDVVKYVIIGNPI